MSAADILTEIAEETKKRVQADAERLPLVTLRAQCETMMKTAPCGGGRLREALAKPGMCFICEVKKASPSKGLISADFPYLQIAKAYEEAGADAISCLTEPKWFLGSDAIFCEIRETVQTPMLRKDFTVDTYQIYQAKAMGADAVLLICAITEESLLKEYLALCEELRLDALVETHDEAEIETALRTGATILGVNNRNLKDFSVDFSNAVRMRSLVPDDVLFVAESGVSSPGDVRALKDAGADACLVGEALMRADDPGAFLQAMRKAVA